MLGRRWLVPVAAAFIVVPIATVVALRTQRVSDADMREARMVVRHYLDAYERHDGRAICTALMPHVRKQIARSDDPNRCARELARRSRIAEIVPPGRPRATIRRVAHAGLGARLTVSLEWPNGAGVGMGMQRAGDRWLLDSDQTCLTPSCQP
jgi:hypothetical protein